MPAGLEMGPQLSGTVRTERGLFLPVNQWSGEARTFSVYANDASGWREVSGGPVNSREGRSQGAIDPVGRGVWATWSEFLPGGDGTIRIRAAEVGPDGREFTRRVTLHEGGPIGPGFTQAVEFEGNPVFGYMRNIDGKVKATVDFSLAD